MRRVMALAKSLRCQPNSASIGFISTENAIDEALWALIATTPIRSAVHAIHDSPSGPAARARGLNRGEGMVARLCRARGVNANRNGVTGDQALPQNRREADFDWSRAALSPL